MDGFSSASGGRSASPGASRRWIAHAQHQGTIGLPHQFVPRSRAANAETRVMSSTGRVRLDGSKGEGGGQILRTALSLSMITGRPFHISKIRANRDKPGLRPQHLAAVEAAALLCGADVSGGSVGSRELIFRPGPIQTRDLEFDIGTAGATALVLQTLHLPIALKADRPVRIAITGGTFNTKAPSYPFLESCWRSHLAAMGLPIALSMPVAGFFPRGGGRIEAWIEPASPKPLTRIERGPLRRVWGVAGIANLRHHDIANRLRTMAVNLLAEQGIEAEIGLADWPSPGQGAALTLSAEHAGGVASFVGLGERGKPAESVATEAVAELLAFEASSGAVDLHTADQILLPLVLADGRSEFTVSQVTEHLRTNVSTILAFLDREILLEESEDGSGGVLILGSRS